MRELSRRTTVEASKSLRSYCRQLSTTAAVCLLMAATLLGLGCQPDRRPRLVILYATCSLNRAFLESYDAEVRYTPALGDLASEGLVFERHHTESGQSGISFASIFTGRQAPGHGLPSALIGRFPTPSGTTGCGRRCRF